MTFLMAVEWFHCFRRFQYLKKICILNDKTEIYKYIKFASYSENCQMHTSVFSQAKIIDVSILFKIDYRWSSNHTFESTSIQQYKLKFAIIIKKKNYDYFSVI